MNRNMLRRSASCLLILQILAGSCCMVEANQGGNAEVNLEKMVLELGKEYGFMSVGTQEFMAKNRMVDVVLPEEVAEHDHGILFSDIYDYDGDGAPELLVFRRQEGYVNFEYYEGYLSGDERSEYLFEMYEYSPEWDHSQLSSRFVAGVTDDFTIFTSHTTMTVFRKTGPDGKTDIFMETLLSGQDHPEDICLLRLRYEDKTFHDYSAIRYGALSFGEKSVRYLESEVPEAFGLLSYPNSIKDRLWTLKASADTYDEPFKQILKKGLADYGLTLRTTRYDALQEGHKKQETDKEQNAEETPNIAKALMECSALDFYGVENGELTPLAFTYMHRGKGDNKEGYTSLKLSRSIYTDDPEGTERLVADSSPQ